MARAVFSRLCIAVLAIAATFSVTYRGAEAADLSFIMPPTAWTPAEWKDNGKLRSWVRDRNDNFVDDLIEAGPDQQTVIVDLNQCPGALENSAILRYLNTVGDVVHVGTYLTFVIVTGVDVAEALDIAKRPEVAMVERALPVRWSAQNLQAALVEKGLYSPNTLEDQFGWPSMLSGQGVHLAIMDNGVDNGAYPAVAGFDATTGVETDPAPGLKHGTQMAGFALGPGGMARQAGLVDIKVDDTPKALAAGFEKLIEKQKDWGINVVSFSGSIAVDDGKGAYSQLANILAGRGVVFVASPGGDTAGSLVEAPAAGSGVLAAGTAELNCTVPRGDDQAPYTKGPRVDYVTGPMTLGQHKPEVIMPTGSESNNCTGPGPSNSASTALTAGLAALILQQDKELARAENKASGSVRDLLIRSAEPKGTPFAGAASYPNASPSWAQYWGFGEIDAHAAFRHLTAADPAGRTDLTFLGFDGSTHPGSPYYVSKAVETLSERSGKSITAGVPEKIFARLLNNGPEDAKRVRVNFGFYEFTGGIPKFYDIGTKIVDIAKGKDQEVAIDWVPPALPQGQEHGCILVSIDYGYDSKFADKSNFAQKNIQVATTASPAIFEFGVANPLAGEATIELEVSSEAKGWKVELAEVATAVSGGNCRRAVRATVEPPTGAAPGTEALFLVTIYAKPLGREEREEVGGVGLKVRAAQRR